MKKGTITAIVPTYNRAHLLPETLASLMQQTRPLHEIIVWDDGSQDETAKVATEATGSVRYFRSENGGKSRALNAALREATGDYIWICDDDDIALPDAAERLAAPLDSEPELGISGGAYRRFRNNPANGKRMETGPGYWPDLSQGSVLRHLLEDIFLFQNAMLVRRSCYAEVGPFREDLARAIDYDMIVRLAARFPIAMTEDVVFLQRKHDGKRGPAAARHSAMQSDAVWKVADQAVFAPFRDALPLALYEAMYDSESSAARRRAALLQRACVYARRTDWATALQDFASAAEILPEVGLSETEVKICRRAVSGKHGCIEIAAPEVRAALTDLADRSLAGRGIVRSLARGLVWRIRAAVLARNTTEVRHLLSIFLAGFSLRIRRSFRSGPPLPTQTEHRVLPRHAYVTLRCFRSSDSGKT